MFAFKERHNFILALFLNSLFLFLVFGAFYCSFFMKMNGQKIDCPFDNDGTQCMETPLQHIKEWQDVFAIPLSKELASVLSLLILSFFVLGGYRIILTKFSKDTLLKLKHLRLSLHIEPLKEAFSDGILNSKIYHRA